MCHFFRNSLAQEEDRWLQARIALFCDNVNIHAAIMQKHNNHKCFPKHLSNVSEVCKIFSHRSKIVTKPFLANYTCPVCDPQVSGLSIASHRCTPITHTVGRPGSPRRSLILINRRTQKSEFVDVDPLSHLSSGAR